MSECRLPGCSNVVTDGVGMRNAFCCTACSLKYQHIRADARDAKRAAEERGY